MPLSIEISTSNHEENLQVSKARKLPILIDTSEMQALFSILGPFDIFDVSRPVQKEQAQLSKQEFLTVYDSYVNGIKKGKLIDENNLRSYFSAVITSTPKALYAQVLPNGKVLIKAKLPVIQLQRHHFIYSDTFHSGVMGEGSVTWGMQFSYPQLYLDPQTKAIGKVEKNPTFPNTELFQRLAKWVRNETAATPFLINGKRVNQPMRLGKGCFEWIHCHPTLKTKGIDVENRSYPQISH